MYRTKESGGKPTLTRPTMPCRDNLTQPTDLRYSTHKNVEDPPLLFVDRPLGRLTIIEQYWKLAMARKGKK